MGQREEHLTRCWAYISASGALSLLPPAAVTAETCPLQGLLSCLPDPPVGRPSLASTPSSGSSSSGSPGARGQGSPLPISECDLGGRAPTLESGGLDPMPCSLSLRLSFPRR